MSVRIEVAVETHTVSLVLEADKRVWVGRELDPISGPVILCDCDVSFLLLQASLASPAPNDGHPGEAWEGEQSQLQWLARRTLTGRQGLRCPVRVVPAGGSRCVRSGPVPVS